MIANRNCVADAKADCEPDDRRDADWPHGRVRGRLRDARRRFKKRWKSRLGDRL